MVGSPGPDSIRSGPASAHAAVRAASIRAKEELERRIDRLVVDRGKKKGADRTRSAPDRRLWIQAVGALPAAAPAGSDTEMYLRGVLSTASCLVESSWVPSSRATTT